MNDAWGPHLNLLVFSVGEVLFGVDSEQVASVTRYHDEQSEDLFWFHREMRYRNQSVAYASPVVISIRTQSGRPFRIIIDSMEEIADYGRNEIRPLPPLLEPFALQKGIWGVVPRRGKLVLLVDFLRFGSHPDSVRALPSTVM